MAKVMRSLVRGPLAPYVAGFPAELLGQGYTRSSAEQHVCFVAHLDRWLVTEGLGVPDQDAATVQRYLSERRASGNVLYLSAKAMRPLLGYVSPRKVLSAEPPPELDAVEALLSRYRDYLLGERGLSPGTVEGYVHLARPSWRADQRGPGQADRRRRGIAGVGGSRGSALEAVWPAAGLDGLAVAGTARLVRPAPADGPTEIRDRAAADPSGAPVRRGRRCRPGRHRLARRAAP
jgi:hypothetical protein